MRIRFILPVLLFVCLTGSTAYAAAGREGERTASHSLAEDDRYDPVYYQEPEPLYPSAGGARTRSVGRTLEEYVVDGLEQFQTEIHVLSYEIPKDEAAERFFQILNNHPSLFYVASYVSWSYDPYTGMVVSYEVRYTDTEGNVRNQKEVFDNEIEAALAWVDPSMTTAEQALAIHDYLALDCEYDYERAQADNEPELSHSAYGALVEKTAVCDGYAKAYASILERLGISSRIVASDSMNHAWNLVFIDGAWYHVDVTWDDPVWDNIGCACHNYFLLSDAAVSDADHEHEGWDSNGYTADSTTYDSAFWSEIASAFCYQQGNWYYARYNGTDGSTSLVKKQELLGGQEEIVYKETETWNNYMDSFMYLDIVNDDIYFNTRTNIRKVGTDGSIATVYGPSGITGDRLIFGFTVREPDLCYVQQDAPAGMQKQQILSHTLEELKLSVITDVGAQDLMEVYDGEAKGITITGLKENDIVSYSLEGGSYSTRQPEIINAGTYEVWYKIEREGCKAYIGKVRVVVEKAEPPYVVPAGLKGNSGRLLSEIALPAGFVWESGGTAKLVREGENTYYVSYIPEDTDNYEVVSRIPVQIMVSCPGHQYSSKVTVEPTSGRKGQMTYVCGICGDTYTEELEPLPSGGTTGTEMPDKASGLKVRKATANSLRFTWQGVQGVRYQLTLYNGNTRVSVQYTEGSAFTFRKLKPASSYTLRILPYHEVSGRKIYASGDASVKAVTAPGKVKLVSAGKLGKTKGKVKWKRTAGADGYEISMRTGKGRYKVIGVVTKGKKVTFTKAGLKRGRRYRFRVRAYKKSGGKRVYGNYSKEKILR